MTDKIALFVVRAAMMPVMMSAMMPALTYKVQGYAFTAHEIHQIAKPLMRALKHACHLPTSFPSSIVHHRLAGKVPRLERVHAANNLTLLARAMNAPTPLLEIALARIAATEQGTRFPGPMLGIPWHVQRGHLTPTDNRRQRLLMPALTTALHEHGVTIGTPEHTPQWTAAHALPTPPRWLFGLFRRPMTRVDLAKAYDRACIWVSDVVRYDEQRRTVALQPQTPGDRPAFIRQIREWVDDVNAAHAETNGPPSAEQGDWLRLRAALRPAGRWPSNAAHPPRPRPSAPRSPSRSSGASTAAAAHPPALMQGGRCTPTGRSCSRTGERWAPSQPPSPRDRTRPPTSTDACWTSR